MSFCVSYFSILIFSVFSANNFYFVLNLRYVLLTFRNLLNHSTRLHRISFFYSTIFLVRFSFPLESDLIFLMFLFVGWFVVAATILLFYCYSICVLRASGLYNTHLDILLLTYWILCEPPKKS